MLQASNGDLSLADLRPTSPHPYTFLVAPQVRQTLIQSLLTNLTQSVRPEGSRNAGSLSFQTFETVRNISY
jgi:hypothetical protein